ncbi:hypothetical protein SSS_04499 [Sarcoptes scabiei]|uniref:E3 ubiquitin-protein ligase CHFR n=1 Tax=Sarcoptes scabiei TaxID=52283 RepID=A0A834VCD3_SARSC|nr:hypothetical protein SSS_04499 [Sarcoptes scabiei]
MFNDVDDDDDDDEMMISLENIYTSNLLFDFVDYETGKDAILILQGSKRIHFKLSAKEQCRFGRDSDCDYQLRSIEISKKHFEIKYENSEWIIQDLNSLNGIYVDDRFIEDKTTLSDKCQISCGRPNVSSYKFIFFIDYEAYVIEQLYETYQITGDRKLFSNSFYEIATNFSHNYENLKNLFTRIKVIEYSRLKLKLLVRLIRVSTLQMLLDESDSNCLNELDRSKREFLIKIEEFHLFLSQSFSDYSKQALIADRNNNDENFIAKTNHFDQLIKEELICSICLGLLIKPKMVNCGHIFCSICIDRSMSMLSTCPYCRTYITFFSICENLNEFVNLSIHFSESSNLETILN